MKQRALKEWLSGINGVSSVDCLLTDIASDSRQLRPGVAFLAYPGDQYDGRDFIADAIKRGAAAIIYESPYDLPVDYQNTEMPFVSVPHLSQCRAELAARFYDYPSKKLPIVGVTGTNGKTSCVDFIAQALSQRGESCSVLGTMGVGLWPELTPSGMTTLDAVALQRCLFQQAQGGATVAAMEVSSHGLALGRVQALDIDIAVFTQLSRDHLDFHGSMEAYEKAKMSLFKQPGLRAAVINVDDACGQKIVQQEGYHLSIVGVSLKPSSALDIPLVCVRDMLVHENGFDVLVSTPWGSGWLAIPLLGKFSVYNVLSVIGVLGCLSWSWEHIKAAVTRLQPVPGRMQCLGGNDGPLVVVDYAHTPDALEQVLLSLRVHGESKITCLFGCGGDRDRGKRPLMARVVEQYADNWVLTSDNPRFEDPVQIEKEVLAGFNHPDQGVVESDRASAIHCAIQSADTGDVILIAGKGHESMQIVGDQELPFSDVEIAKAALEQRGCCV